MQLLLLLLLTNTGICCYGCTVGELNVVALTVTVLTAILTGPVLTAPFSASGAAAYTSIL